MKNVSGTRSRPVVSTALFLAAVLGQVWFWRKLLFGGSLAGQPPVLYVELAFLAVILALALLTARPRGLGGKKRCAAALAGFALYRWLMTVDIPVGSTLPDMLLTMALCAAVRKLLPKRPAHD